MTDKAKTVERRNRKNKRKFLSALKGISSGLVLLGLAMIFFSNVIMHLRKSYHASDLDSLWQVFLAARLRIWGIGSVFLGLPLWKISYTEFDRTFSRYHSEFSTVSNPRLFLLATFVDDIAKIKHKRLYFGILVFIFLIIIIMSVWISKSICGY